MRRGRNNLRNKSQFNLMNRAATDITHFPYDPDKYFHKDYKQVDAELKRRFKEKHKEK